MGAENRCLEGQLYGGTGGDAAAGCSSINGGTLTVGKTYWGWLVLSRGVVCRATFG